MWRHLFPFLSWPRPTSEALGKDAWAGLSVALVLIPQALAYATLAGMPPQTGLYAALLPAVVGILWGSSPLLAVGPVALTSLLTYASLFPLATPASSDWVTLAIWLAIYSGIIQFLLGALRLGSIANFVSDPVITGFINAAALIIILSQVPPLLGLPALTFEPRWILDALAVVHGSPGQVVQTAACGVGALMLLALQRRYAPRLPGILLVCVGAIIVSAVLNLEQHGITVVGAIPKGFGNVDFPPKMAWSDHLALLPAALIIALISFTEAMSSCRILARQSNSPWEENQELIGQGLAKIASGISGAFPVSGSFSRSALNAYVGATSGWSALFTALCVLACLLWATDWLYYLPRAVLAAIIIMPVLRLIDIHTMRALWRLSPGDGLVATVTFIVTLAATPYLHFGVMAGLLISFMAYFHRLARPRIHEVPWPATVTAPSSSPPEDAHAADTHAAPDDVLAVSMDAALVFATAPLLERFITHRLRNNPELRTVLLCCGPINQIDATGLESLRRLTESLAAVGKGLRLSSPNPQLKAVLQQSGLLQRLGDDGLYPTDHDAFTALAQRPHNAEAA